MEMQSGPGFDLLDILAGGAIALAVVGIVAWIFLKKNLRATAARAVWEGAAQKLSIEMNVQTPFGGNPSATFTIQGIPGSLGQFENYALMTQIRLAMARPPRGGIGFYPRAENFLGRYSAFVSWVDVDDPTLDSICRVHSDPPELYRSLYGPDLQVLFRKHRQFFEHAFMGIVEGAVEVRLMKAGTDADNVALAIEVGAEVSRILDGQAPIS